MLIKLTSDILFPTHLISSCFKIQVKQVSVIYKQIRLKISYQLQIVASILNISNIFHHQNNEGKKLY